MTNLRAESTFRLHLHAHEAAHGWWFRRPWAHALEIVDTSAFEPRRRLGLPLVSAPRTHRARRAGTDVATLRPGQPRAVDRRGFLEGPGAAYRSWQVPAALKLVDDDEAKRLEQARGRIEFRPRNGFLYATRVGRLPREG